MRPSSGQSPRSSGEAVAAEPEQVGAAAVLAVLRDAAKASAVERIAYTREEAASSLGVSVDHFERHVAADLRVIRSGRKPLYPVSELRRWADDHATLTLNPKETG